jgi:hypothetical protein
MMPSTAVSVRLSVYGSSIQHEVRAGEAGM